MSHFRTKQNVLRRLELAYNRGLELVTFAIKFYSLIIICINMYLYFYLPILYGMLTNSVPFPLPIIYIFHFWRNFLNEILYTYGKREEKYILFLYTFDWNDPFLDF